MAEPEISAAAIATDHKLYTLSEISQKTGISMPTLQRYKKTLSGPHSLGGQGRKQRYPESALPVFDEIRNENVGRRGRPRKDRMLRVRSVRRRASAVGVRRPPPSAAAAPAVRRGQGGQTPARAAKASGRRQERRRRGRKAAAAAAACRPARRGRPPGRANQKPAAKSGSQKSGNLLTLTQISEHDRDLLSHAGALRPPARPIACRTRGRGVRAASIRRRSTSSASSVRRAAAAAARRGAARREAGRPRPWPRRGCRGFDRRGDERRFPRSASSRSKRPSRVSRRSSRAWSTT